MGFSGINEGLTLCFLQVMTSTDMVVYPPFLLPCYKYDATSDKAVNVRSEITFFLSLCNFYVLQLTEFCPSFLLIFPSQWIFYHSGSHGSLYLWMGSCSYVLSGTQSPGGICCLHNCSLLFELYRFKANEDSESELNSLLTASRTFLLFLQFKQISLFSAPEIRFGLSPRGSEERGSNQSTEICEFPLFLGIE